jgi:hypothetical protein
MGPWHEILSLNEIKQEEGGRPLNISRRSLDDQATPFLPLYHVNIVEVMGTTEPSPSGTRPLSARSATSASPPRQSRPDDKTPSRSAEMACFLLRRQNSHSFATRLRLDLVNVQHAQIEHTVEEQNSLLFLSI